MCSIAMFPCLFTDGARLIGELSYALGLHVYTDEMLLNDVSERFGVPYEELAQTVFGSEHSKKLEARIKGQYVQLLKRSLRSKMMLHPEKQMYYGLHTSLLGPYHNSILQLLILDDAKGRLRRAIYQDQVSDQEAKNCICKYDQKASAWTQYLFQKNAYDKCLYDVVISFKNRDLFDIKNLIIKSYLEMDSRRELYQQPVPCFSHADSLRP